MNNDAVWRRLEARYGSVRLIVEVLAKEGVRLEIEEVTRTRNGIITSPIEYGVVAFLPPSEDKP